MASKTASTTVKHFEQISVGTLADIVTLEIPVPAGVDGIEKILVSMTESQALNLFHDLSEVWA